jgi:hypothetical protein
MANSGTTGHDHFVMCFLDLLFVIIVLPCNTIERAALKMSYFNSKWLSRIELRAYFH